MYLPLHNSFPPTRCVGCAQGHGQLDQFERELRVRGLDVDKEAETTAQVAKPRLTVLLIDTDDGEIILDTGR